MSGALSLFLIVVLSWTVYLPVVIGSRPKAGVALAYSHCEDLTSVGGSWHYNWSTDPRRCPDALDVPMIWSPTYFRPDIQSTGKTLLGFNECDLDDQCATSPEVAAVFWHDKLEPAYPSWYLISPAPSHLHPEWLLDFYSAYVRLYGHGPHLDALALHCYLPSALECEALTERYEGWAQAWGIRDVWVTEWSFPTCYTGSVAASLREMTKFVTWMEQEPLVSHYAFFAARFKDTDYPCLEPLHDMSGGLTDMGLNYRRLIYLWKPFGV